MYTKSTCSTTTSLLWPYHEQRDDQDLSIHVTKTLCGNTYILPRECPFDCSNDKMSISPIFVFQCLSVQYVFPDVCQYSIYFSTSVSTVSILRHLSAAWCVSVQCLLYDLCRPVSVAWYSLHTCSASAIQLIPVHFVVVYASSRCSKIQLE